jgi:hypothetical protein
MTSWLHGVPGGAAVIFTALACTVSPGTSAVSPSTHAASPGGAARTAASGPASAPAAGPGPAADCTGAPLKSQLAAAVRDGASVIVAAGTLTGKSVTGDPAAAGAPAFYAMTLHSAQTLRGPAVAPGSTAWIPGPAPGTTASPENSALLAPGGRVFAVAWPKAATRDPVAPTLQLAPIVGTDVVFTPYSCWNLAGLQPGQYQASTPLRPVPGGANFGGTHQAAENGLYTLPLAAVRQIAASA